MPRSTAKLHVVITPEEELTILFAREAELTAELAAVRADLTEVRERYRTKHFLLMQPGLDRLRQMFGGSGA
jgi:Tfp pilus assembly protein PilO